MEVAWKFSLGKFWWIRPTSAVTSVDIPLTICGHVALLTAREAGDVVCVSQEEKCF